MVKSFSIPASTLVVVTIVSVWALFVALSARSEVRDVGVEESEIEKRFSRLETRLERLEKARPAARAKPAAKRTAPRTKRSPTRTQTPEPSERPAADSTTPFWGSLTRLCSAASTGFESARAAEIPGVEDSEITAFRSRHSVPGSQGVTIYNTPDGTYCEVVLHKCANAEEAAERLVTELDRVEGELPDEWSGRIENSPHLTDATGYASPDGSESFLVGVRAGDGDSQWVVIRIDGE